MNSNVYVRMLRNDTPLWNCKAWLKLGGRSPEYQWLYTRYFPYGAFCIKFAAKILHEICYRPIKWNILSIFVTIIYLFLFDELLL